MTRLLHSPLLGTEVSTRPIKSSWLPQLAIAGKGLARGWLAHSRSSPVGVRVFEARALLQPRQCARAEATRRVVVLQVAAAARAAARAAASAAAASVVAAVAAVLIRKAPQRGRKNAAAARHRVGLKLHRAKAAAASPRLQSQHPSNAHIQFAYRRSVRGFLGGSLAVSVACFLSKQLSLFWRESRRSGIH
jgi:hypothetical protein